MEAYGYQVNGDCCALLSVMNNVRDERVLINWNLFKSGDPYFDENGNQYEVKIDHGSKKVHLTIW